jgi:hypothetical protein
MRGPDIRGVLVASRRLTKRLDLFLLGIDFKARSGLNALVPPFA